MLLSSRRTSILVPFAARRSGASIELVEVREAVGEAKAAAPLDRFVPVGEGDPVDAQERRSLRDLEVRTGDTIGRNRAQSLLGADHAHAEHLLVEAVHAAVEFLELGERQSRE